MRIFVSGGLGYIGSHTVVELINAGHEVVIADNLSNSHMQVLTNIETITGIKPPFYQVDVANQAEIDPVFKNYQFDAIMHFAGFKAVGESVDKPLKYYRNNLLSTITLARMANQYDVNTFIFSSSATVYGDQASPMREDMGLLQTTNPYGETKKMSERILTDFVATKENTKVVLLRYFNPIGAHESGLIGEVPRGTPNNLMPYITQVAAGKREKLFVFGNDYDTSDGTGVRDYIHVVDLAKGHVKALKAPNLGINIYNLGTGKGTSVLELINAFETINGIKINYEIVSRRAGDIAVSFASANKSLIELDFQTSKTVNDMVKDSWNFEKKWL